jgi:hypothetical protein
MESDVFEDTVVAKRIDEPVVDATSHVGAVFPPIANRDLVHALSNCASP